MEENILQYCSQSNIEVSLKFSSLHKIFTFIDSPVNNKYVSESQTKFINEVDSIENKIIRSVLYIFLGKYFRCENKSKKMRKYLNRALHLENYLAYTEFA